MIYEERVKIINIFYTEVSALSVLSGVCIPQCEHTLFCVHHMSMGIRR